MTEKAGAKQSGYYGNYMYGEHAWNDQIRQSELWKAPLQNGCDRKREGSSGLKDFEAYCICATYD